MHLENSSRAALYEKFLDLIGQEAQRERRAVNRRMFGVFVWCFLAPAVVSITLLLLVKFQVLPRRVHGYIDWISLVFPIAYSVYFLSSEVFREIPNAFRRGGIWSILKDAQKSGVWKSQVIEQMEKSLPASLEDWDWIIISFRGELDRLLYRARYLTALAGAVFFMIMQGIDAIGPDDQKVSWVRDPVFGWVELSGGDLSEFVGLTLFLVLLYLSSSQSYHYLNRFLNCAELRRSDLATQGR